MAPPAEEPPDTVVEAGPVAVTVESGKVAVGRVVVAYGYWQDQNFYATAIY